MGVGIGLGSLPAWCVQITSTYWTSLISFQVDTGKIVWPPWIETLTNVSHLLTVFNSSVNFYIYFAKHYQSILGRQSSTQNEETVRLTNLSTYCNNQNHNSHSRHNSHITVHRNSAANQLEEARENSKMLVHATTQTAASQQQKNGDLVNLV